MAVSFPSKLLNKESEREMVLNLIVRPMINGKPDGKSYKTFNNNGENLTLPFRYGHLFCKKHNIEIDPLGPFEEVDYNFTGELRDYQIAGLEQVKDHLEQFSTSTVCFHPGAGKTVIGTVAAYICRLKTLVAVHRKTLMKQWVETIINFTNATYHVVGEKNQKTSIEEANIIISMDERFKNISPEIISKIGMILIDEAHCFCTIERSKSLLIFKPRYIVALTATPDRKDGTSSFLLNLVGGHRIMRPFKKPFVVNCRRTGIKPEMVSNKGGTLDWTVYTKSIMENDLRNFMILDDVIKNSDRKILILTKEKSHVTALENLISPFTKVATMMGNKNSYEDSPVLIGTCSKINTGFDAATFADNYDGRPISMVIMCVSFSDENVIQQSAGRGLRAENPLFIYYLDDGGSISKRHWSTFRKWAISCMGKCTYEDVDIKEYFKRIKNGEFDPPSLPIIEDNKLISLG